MPLLTLIVPIYNGAAYVAENVREIVDTLESMGEPFEVLVVCDGSTDGTAAEAESLGDPRVRVLRYALNQGKGYAICFGVPYAQGRLVGWLDGDLDIDRFEHLAFYNSVEGRVEIYIRSLADQTARIAGNRLRFVKNGLIHTEYSYKYSVAEFRALAARAGFRPVDTWTDPAELFSVHYFRLR